MTGKEKCRLLKQIRKEIAEANGIVYLTSECDYNGNDCTGTCPKCDAELRYLDSELNRLAASGTPITLAGLSLETFFKSNKVQKMSPLIHPLKNCPSLPDANNVSKELALIRLGFWYLPAKRNWPTSRA